jgi:hypothetical protein
VILPEKIATHRNIDIIFEPADAKGESLHDLEPLMGTDRHCVFISSDAKEFLHVHLVEGVDPELRGRLLVAFMTSFPKQGLYKIWGQLQHKGNTITKSLFIVRVADDASNG